MSDPPLVDKIMSDFTVTCLLLLARKEDKHERFAHCSCASFQPKVYF